MKEEIKNLEVEGIEETLTGTRMDLKEDQIRIIGNIYFPEP